jgi:hypothetical protein
VQRQALILGLAAAALLVSAWLFADPRGVAVAAAGIAFGWLVRHLTPGSAASRAVVVAPVVADDVAEKLRVLQSATSSLRHDLRGILSPALLTSERLLGYEDPVVRRAGEIMVKTVERASVRLAETKGATS